MCNNESPPPTKSNYSIVNSSTMPSFLTGFENYRLQLYHYAMAERIRIAQQLQPQHSQHVNSQPGNVLANQCVIGMGAGFPTPLPLYTTESNYSRGLALSMAMLRSPDSHIPEEPKPQHSYIGLIAMAILSSPEKKLVLSDIYQYILENYPYFRRRGPGWRNSIRHNLSLNDCFVKSGRSANGKGHYWAIHPANLEDFRRGDFRRRKAQRKVRRHMGLAVDEEPDSPSPPPIFTPTAQINSVPRHIERQTPTIDWSFHQNPDYSKINKTFDDQIIHKNFSHPPRKRQFDVASLLAPDEQPLIVTCKSCISNCSPGNKFSIDCTYNNSQSEENIDIEETRMPVHEKKKSHLNDSRYKRNPNSSNEKNQFFSLIRVHNEAH
ncbi:hypothetical protein TKK_0013780 [Trichogramma kaykai]|uniref:Fork-head domain-containing protein n=1 Tax=Trichogramma kaykai TaxID=54128 RepID=A0ABD2WIB0_9HYME